MTAHVAVGSLLLATSVALALYAHRLLAAPAATMQRPAAGNVGGRRMSSNHDHRRIVAARLVGSRAPAGSRASADFVELTKPRIVALELVTVVVAAHLASPRGIDPWVLLHTVLGAALVAASAGAFNQWWKQSTDAPDAPHRQPPAARRPARRRGKSSRSASSTLARRRRPSWLLCVSSPTAGVAIATWLIYVLAYTPLKTRSPLNTAVGAVSGALPILIGWTADRRGRSTCGPGRWWPSMFLWQFPHFMAIAWLYRDDYARAGQRMLTVVDPTGLRAGGPGGRRARWR